tara:strand:- start:2398 stop:3336 length:939 start_codon:yes stop_codon:yes gene_type:complete
MYSVLVTGVAGFIGSNLADFLLNKDFKVFGLDNLITGDKKNIEHLSNDPKFEFIESDVTKFIKIKDKLDFVLHFASPASPVDYLNLPIQTLKANAIGGHNALGIAKKNKAKFLLASTSEVYGDPLVHPQNESYYGNVNPVGPRSIYDEAKRFIESMTIAYHKYHSLNVSIVRIFNTYGPRMRINDGRVLPNFIYQASKNQDITVNGDGNQTRSFCYIDDLILGIYNLLKINYSFPINLGNDDEITINEVAQIILKLTKSNSKIVYKDLPFDDPIMRKPDLSTAKEKLNWSPKVSKEEGFKILIDYYNSKNLI